jgi:photosystem II stability/assembly factor-like uncharacterized protein
MKFWQTILPAVAIAALACCAIARVRAQEWQRIGPEGGNVISLAILGNGDVLLGTADGHVFASRNAGEHWELRGRAGSRFDGVVQSLVADRQVGTRVYAAVWTLDPYAGGGVFRSEDAGQSWTSAGLDGEAVRALAQSPNSPEVLVAGTRNGVFRSPDGGRDWERISPPRDEELKNLDSIAIDPRDANVIYAGTYHLPWKTTDGGKSWKAIAAGMIDDSDVMSIVIDRENPERIFASACSGIYRSENGGSQWTKLQGIPYVSRRTQQIAQDPKNAAIWYAGTTEGLWRSIDAGENWTRATTRDSVVNTIAFAGKGERLLLGTEKGILLSADGARSFATSNSGFTHPVVRAFAVSEGDAKHMLIAVENDGNGLLESLDEGKNWRSFPAPKAIVDELFSTGENWYAALRGGGVARFDAKTKKWTEIRFVARELVRQAPKGGGAATKKMRERILKPDAIALRAAGGRLFVGTNEGLWTGTLTGGVMQRVAGKQLPGKVADLDANAAGSELFVVAQNRLMRSRDLGKSWDSVAALENLGELLWVRTENRESQEVLVGTLTGVYEYDFGPVGDKAQLWKGLQSGLPAAPSLPAVLGSEFWLIPMRAGMYMSRDHGENWERFSIRDAGQVQLILKAGKTGYWARSQTDGLFLMKIEGRETNSKTGPF